MMSVTAFTGPERRRHSRAKLEALAYIHFEPDNRGIAIDVSEGGLCFHALSPVHAGEVRRFWLSVEGRRVDGEGVLAWTDQTRKHGGLTFQGLSLEAREAIRQWIEQSAVGFAADDALAKFPAPPLLGSGDALTAAGLRGSAATEALVAVTRAPMPLSGFTRGLLSGLLISTVIAGSVLLHAYRRQVGESLIRFGEQLASKPRALQPTAEVTIPPARIENPPRPSSPPLPQAKPHAAIRIAEPAIVVSGTPAAAFLPLPLIPHPGPPLMAIARSGQPQPADPEGDTRAPALESGSRPSPVSEIHDGSILASPKGSYIDAGDYKQKDAAEGATRTLGQLGFHAVVNHRGHLWMASYHVLLGPYRSDAEAETARNDLEAQGIQLRFRGRKSRNLALPRMTLDGTDTVVKDCMLSWDANSSAVTVTFLKGQKIVAVAQGKWSKRGIVYPLDAVVSTAGERGPKTLLEIQCRGMDRTVQIDESKPVRYFTPPPQRGT